MTGVLERPTAARPAELIPGVCVRAATTRDAARVRRFLQGLSLDSAYRRFFTGLGSVPESLVRRLLDPAGGRTVVLAVAADEIVGIADTSVCGHAVELGVVVADRWQRQGLGWPLADAALEPALAAGVRTLRAHTLADNARVARMLRRRWPAAKPRFDDGTLVWDIDLTGDTDLTGDMDLTGPVARER
jgi:GNAT superfamily N-acetyltransferase